MNPDNLNRDDVTYIKAASCVDDPDDWREPPRCPLCDDEDWAVEKRDGRLYCTFCGEDVTPVLT